MEKIADALNVSPAALNVPDIESHVGGNAHAVRS